MSWVEEEVARIKREDGRQKAAQEWAIHKSAVLTERAVEVWDAVASQIRKDVAKLNASFSGDERRQIEIDETPAFGLSLKAKSTQLFQVVVRMATSGRSIKFTSSEVRNTLGVPVDRENSIVIDLDAEENILFNSNSERIGSVDVVSKKILDPFLLHFRG